MASASTILTVKAFYAWKNTPEQFSVSICDTVGSLKSQLGKGDGVPARLVRIVHQGRALLDDQAEIARSTLWTQRGSLSSSVEFAVLYPQRDEDGVVEVSLDGIIVLTLQPGEWSVHTTVRNVKQRLAAEAIAVDGKEIVYNALTLPDASNFGQNEIHKGAVLCLV